MYLPNEIYSKITLYNSTVLCDLFKSTLKANSLMMLSKLNSGRYIRLWHYIEPMYGYTWSFDIERKIRYYKNKGGGRVSTGGKVLIDHNFCFSHGLVILYRFN